MRYFTHNMLFYMFFLFGKNDWNIMQRVFQIVNLLLIGFF